MKTPLLQLEPPGTTPQGNHLNNVWLGLSTAGHQAHVGGWVDGPGLPLLFCVSSEKPAPEADEGSALNYLRMMLTKADLYAVVEEPVWSQRGRTRDRDAASDWQRLLGNLATMSRFHVVDPFSWRAKMLRGLPGDDDRQRAQFFCAHVLQVGIEGRTPADCLALSLAYYARWHHGVEKAGDRIRGGRS